MIVISDTFSFANYSDLKFFEKEHWNIINITEIRIT